MTVDEAALAVESGDDAFLVFRNAATDAVSVLYRRKDGDLGLIEPEAESPGAPRHDGHRDSRRQHRRAAPRASRGARPPARAAVPARHGLDRRITSPHIQKTGLALAGFDAYLSAGRILILGESEIRFLESLAGGVPAGSAAADLRARHPGGDDHRRARRRPPELLLASERAGVPLLAHAAADADRHRESQRDPRGLAGRADDHPRRADGHPRARRAHRRGERHRQERVRARPGRPRASARRRRHGRNPAARRERAHRHVSGPDAAPHGSARPRPDQHPGPVRRRLDAIVQAGRAGGAARAMGAGRRVRAAGPGRGALRDPRPAGAAAAHAGGARAQRRRSSSRWRRAIRCCGHAATTPPASWRRGSNASSWSRTPARSAPRPIGTTGRRAKRDARRETGRRSAAGRRRQPLRRPHRTVGGGEVAGDPGARGPGLLLRGQSAAPARSRRWPSCRCGPGAT